MKAYKGFTKDMTCRGFQFEEGKTYTHDGEVKLCKAGFHACEDPIDCFAYYYPGESVFHEVELDGVSDETEDDSRRVAKTIQIGAKLDVAGICKAHFEYVRSKCTNENNAENGKPATAGYRGAATAGDCGAATAGYRGAATAGYRGAATAGDCGAATAGDCGAATAGDCGAATSRGLSSVGVNGIAVVRGNNVKSRGGLGSILVIAEESETPNEITNYTAVLVDGEKIKADTWYGFVDGELREVE